MRIATSMIYNAGVSTMNKQSAALLHLQQQISSGRRILTPADDPVAAARALEVTQSKVILGQFLTNQENANSALGQVEAQLNSVNDILARIKELTVQAGNASVSATDRRMIAFELRARFDELLGIANAADGQGQYLFSGYMGSTKPFTGNVDQLNAALGNEIVYQGDDGQRALQVSATRMLEISDSGNDVFRRIHNGNSYFVTNYAATNTGTGVVDAGSIVNPATWNALTNKNFSIVFTVDNSVTPSVTYYDIVDTTTNISLLSGAPAPAPPANQRIYYPGKVIDLKSQGVEPPFDLGASLVINGDPATGDQFTLTPSSSQSLFKTLATLIAAIESANTAVPGDAAKYANEIGFALTNIDQANDNILRVRAMIGSRMSELESINNVNQDMTLQYEQTLSNLQDVDYVRMISDLTRKQTDLQAALQSFARISQLSLFNYL